MTKKGKKKAVRAKKGSPRPIARRKRRPRRRPPQPKKKRLDYKEVIANRLLAAASRAKANGVDAITMGPVRNADGSVDGEIRFVRPAGEPTRGFLLDVEQWIQIPRGVWVSVGGRFEPSTSVMQHVQSPTTSRYEKEQGMLNIGAFFQRGKTKASVFLAARDYVPGMEKTVNRRALEVYVRLNWNKKDRQPDRVGTPIKKRRKPLRPKSKKKGKGNRDTGRVQQKRNRKGRKAGKTNRRKGKR